MKQVKMLFGVLLLICMCLLPTSIGALAANEMAGKTVVIYTGNLRGNVDVLPKIAQLEKDYKAKGAEVMIVDVGNFLQGSVYSTYDSGKTLVNLMVTAGYDVVTIGSHEFDFGTGKVGVDQHEVYYQDDTLGKILSDANLDATSVNIMTKTTEGTDINAYSASVTVTTNTNKKVSFVGLTDPNTVNQVLETNLTGLTFLSGDALLTAAKNQAAAAKSAGSISVIALGNTGEITAVDGTAAVVDISADAGLTAGIIVVNESTGSVESNNLVDLSSVTAEATVKTAVDSAKAAIDQEYPAQNVVNNNFTLNGSQVDVRSKETNLGDFWSDALLWFAKEGGIANYYTEEAKNEGNTKIMVDNDHIVALWNGGNLRDYLNTGSVTIKDIQRVLPYPNRVAVVYLKGSDLLEQLEACSQGLPYSAETVSQCASFMQVAGINYTVDAYKTYDKGEAYELHNTWFRAKSVNRVTINNINGKAFKPNDTYAVITSNANYNGMDASYVMLDRKDEQLSTITSADVRNVALMYVQDKLKGNIGQQYIVPQGRITVNETEYTSTYTDVFSGDWHFPYVSQVTNLGLMYGLGNNRFGPDETTTRAMLVTILHRMSGSPKTRAAIPYTDVPGGEWYSQAVAWATEQGIVYGTSETTFGTNEAITREQMVAMFYRYADLMARDVTLSDNLAAFRDRTSISSYATDAFRWAVAAGIVHGTSDTALSPKASSTRAQIATVMLLYRESAY